MRKRITRAAAAAFAIAIGAASLSACGPAADGGTEKLVYWSMWQEGEDQQIVLQEALDEFSESTGIEVDVQWTGRDVRNQVIPRLTSGNPPDLTDGSLGEILTFGEDEIRDLTALWETKIEGEDVTIREALGEPLLETVTGAANGKPIIVPYEIIGSTLWYNAKTAPVFAEQTPATWDELIAVLDELKAAGRTPVAVDGDIADYEAYWVNWALRRAGGPGTLLNAVQDETGESFESDEWVLATDTIEQLISGGYFPSGFNGTKFPTQQSAWADQTSATDLILMGSWLPSEASSSLEQQGKDAAELVEFRSFPFPALADSDPGAGVVEATPIGFGIPDKARNPDAAEQFIAFFLNKDRLEKIASVAKNLTPRADVAPPAVLADFAVEYANATAFSAPSDGVDQVQPKWLADVWQPAILDFFAGNTSAEQFRAVLKEKTISYHANQ